MSDNYDRMDREQLLRVCRTWGRPSWADFDTATIRQLLRADDLDRDDVERYYSDSYVDD